MKKVVRNRILIVFSVLLVLGVLTFAFTQARYSDEATPDNHTGELEYTLANQVTISTTEQFFAAIENGYSNIKISETVSNPFLVTGSADVMSDLILDLNGHEIQRNSREPMLTVKEGVKMIVTDTSKSQTGSFYNPVGSVLRVDGGVLTVMSNKFESGPRNDEFYSNIGKTSEKDGLQYIGGTIYDTPEIEVYKRETEGYSVKKLYAPILLPYVKQSNYGAVIDGKSYFVNGNIYFDTIPTSNSPLVTNDTYFYFTIDDQNALSTNIVASEASADYHYKYYVKKVIDSTTGVPEYQYAGLQKAEGVTEVTIYVYHNVIASARNEVDPYTTTPSNFAAIKMLKGTMYARGGEFFSYFGVDSSSCIYADEGNLSVYDGSYTAIEEGTAIQCNFLKSESSFTVTGGNFQSFKGDTIEMLNGEMTITGGTFVKDATGYKDGNAGSNNNNSAIRLVNGSINLNSAKDTPINFYLGGSYMAAIECGENAMITANGVNYQFGTTNGTNSVKGGSNIGILSTGGNVNIDNCVFIQPGDLSYGIYSYDPNNEASTNTIDVCSTMFSMGGERCTGIYASGGTINIGSESDMYIPDRSAVVYDATGKPHVDKNGNQVTGVSIDNYTIFYLDHVANCYGVYVEKKESTAAIFRTSAEVNVYAGQFVIGSGYAPNGLPYAEVEIPISDKNHIPSDIEKVYLGYAGYDAEGKEITKDATELQKDEMVWSAGVYLNDPTAVVGMGKVRMIIGGCYSAGIFAEEGHVYKLYDEVRDKDVYGNDTPEDNKPTTVLFIGTRIVAYQNGGYLDSTATEKNKRWNYLYKHAYDYYQTKDFVSYYDRIVDCNSSDNYGIAAKAGTIDMGRMYINLRSNFSRGIFAASSETTTSSVKLDHFMANIDSMVRDANEPEKFVLPEALTTTIMTIRNGQVEIKDADLRTNSVGIMINNGQLTFKGNINIESINASAVYMTSTVVASAGTTGLANNLTVDENAVLTVFCNITERSSTNLTTPIPWKLKGFHGRYDTNESTGYTFSRNGLNIKGGSLTCDGELILDFHGLDNPDQEQSKYDPYNIPLTSCAINVEELTANDSPFVRLWYARITSGKLKTDYKEGDPFHKNVSDITSSNGGGGISVMGGSVQIGRTSDAYYTDPAQKGYKVLNSAAIGGDYDKLVTIETCGYERHTVLHGNYKNWNYYVSKTGGPGIKVESGTVTVRYGTYKAAQGNGIVLTGGDATIGRGIFHGRNLAWQSSEGDSNGSGLGSYYGFMLRGGGKLTIYDGHFLGFNGGAFVTGHNGNIAEAYVYGGLFEDMPERRLERVTTNGFSVGAYATVVIGKENPGANDTPPEIAGIACGLAVENDPSFNNDFGAVNITIQGGAIIRASIGTRPSNIHAIWKGNADATLKFGECTLLQQQDGNGDILVDTVVTSDTSTWRNALLNSTDYVIYGYTSKTQYTQITNLNSRVNSASYYKIVIAKK